MIKKSGEKKIFEAGCGEGQLIGVLHGQGFDVSGMDLEESNVRQAKNNFRSIGGDDVPITVGNLYDLKPTVECVQGRMLICCEVLEHVQDPQKALEIISACTNEYFIVSVPNEPLWCILHFLCGKNLKHFGNTPGHINHWTKSGFRKLVSQYGEILEVRMPMPWTMILARKHNC